METNGANAPEFTDEQLRAVLERVGREACQASFAARLPVYVVRDSQLVELHADGTEKVVATLSPGVESGRSE